MNRFVESCPIGVALLLGALTACSQSKGARPDGGAATSGTDAAAGRPDSGGGLGRGVAGEGGQGQGPSVGGATGSLGGMAGSGNPNTGGGGAGGAALEPYFRAGTRLKPRVFRVGDLEVIDETQEGGWYDVETHDWCRFLLDADGVERCLPYASLSDDPTQIVYLDAGCTRPAVVATTPYCDDAAGAPRYITGPPSSGCAYRTYQIGDLLPIATPLYGKAGGSCESLPAKTMYDGFGVWPLGPEVPLSTFVAVKRVSRPRHPRMNALVREGEDGSSEIIGFSDPSTGAPCSGLGLDISPQVCVPDWLAPGDYFSDMACTQPVRVGVGDDENPGCSLRKPTVILEVASNAFVCPWTMSIGGLWKSAGVRATPVFAASTDGTDAECSTGVFTPTVAYDLGSPIDLATIPQLDVIEVGSGPLTMAFYGFGGVPFFPAPRKYDAPAVGRFTDVARRQPCEPFPFGDGKWRCVPPSFAESNAPSLFYESSDCTGTLAYREGVPMCSGTTRELTGIVLVTSGREGCTRQPIGATLELGGPVTQGSPISQSRSSLCLSTTASPSMNLVEVTRQLNPDEVFVPMEHGLKN